MSKIISNFAASKEKGNEMPSAEVANMIPQLQAYFKNQPIEYAYLFGSCARGEETKDSDVDILFAPKKEAFFSLLTYAHIHRELEELLHRKVDLVADGTLRPMAEETAQRDKVKIYERSRS